MAVDRTLPATLTDKIREDILKENFAPGSKLTESALGSLYEVSRTPIREALRNLTVEGLVEWMPNRGVFVIGFSKGDVSDLFQLRKIHETQAVKWAIERIYRDELENLEQTYNYMEFYTERGDTRKMRTLNTDFHRIICEASHNRMIIDTLALYRNYCKHSVRIAPYRREHLPAILEEHASVFDAFINRDPCMGGKAMETHIARSAERAMPEKR
ncbi:MAG: GntR family transcriptional regulator [Clostridiales Family XIII bacterium]|jgi:DNA-binding GntR family transcriptional regulator|nr:GntR family transcriptional regulator [Clostridiales Family XIII bacterium]